MAGRATVLSSSSNTAIDDAIKSLAKISISSGNSGKENCVGKEASATAQRCLKVAISLMGKPKQDVQQLVALCQASLRILDKDRSINGAQQAQTAAYSAIRQFMSAKAFGPALEEALRLHEQLNIQHKMNSKGSKPLSSHAINLAVGAVITLALCWAEGVPTTSHQLASILQAAESYESLFT